MLNIHSRDYGQISARSWRPTSELEWETAKPYSYWDSTIVGLQTSSWSNFPKAGGEALVPAQLELGNTEALINFPSFISRPATIKRYLATGGSPPPPPTQPESSWEGGQQANYGRSTATQAPSVSHRGDPPFAPAAEYPPVYISGDYGSPSEFGNSF